MKLRYKISAVIGMVAVATTGTIAYSALNKPAYILATNDSVSLKPLIYAADVKSGTVVRGIPDGMGAYKNEDGRISLLSVHERRCRRCD